MGRKQLPLIDLSLFRKVYFLYKAIIYKLKGIDSWQRKVIMKLFVKAKKTS